MFLNRDEARKDYHRMYFQDYSPDELRAVSRKGGINSGKARRKKRAAIEREKIKNAAIREQHRENWQTIDQAMSLYLASLKNIARARGVRWK